MKKIVVLIALLAVVTTADAKIRLGVKGGLNFASLSYSQESLNNLVSSRTGWHAGIAMNVGLPLGLSLQPEILYSSKGKKDGSIGYIEVPVDLQWGLSLPMVRPYVALTPYVSYKTNNGDKIMNTKSWDGGIGVGAGVDIWKLQIAVKYMWGLGKAIEYVEDPKIPEIATFSAKNRNIMLSVGFFL